MSPLRPLSRVLLTTLALVAGLLVSPAAPARAQAPTPSDQAKQLAAALDGDDSVSYTHLTLPTTPYV